MLTIKWTKFVIVKIFNKWGGRYGANNLIASNSFHNRAIFDDNLIAFGITKTNILLNKLLYITMAILDLLKICLYDFLINIYSVNFVEFLLDNIHIFD